MTEIPSGDEVRHAIARAVELRDTEEYEEALDILLGLTDEASQFEAYWAVRGHVLWELKRLGEAVECFRHASKLAPKSEAVSLGLFHCLLGLGREDEAFDEMRRFLGLRESDEYKRLLADINAAE